MMDNINKVLENETNSDDVLAVNERLEGLKEQIMNLVRFDNVELIRKNGIKKIKEIEYKM